MVNRLAGLATVALLVAAFVAAIPVFGLAIAQAFGGYQSHAVLTGSMVPAMPVGSLVISRATPAAAVRTGDIITFHAPSGVLVTHRILRKVDSPVDVPGGQHRTFFETKGDANNTADRWRVPDEGSTQRVVLVIPRAGYLTEAVSRPLARLLLLPLPGIVLGFILLREIWHRPLLPAQPSGSSVKSAA